MIFDVFIVVCAISLATNAVGIWYLRNVLRNFYDVTSNMKDLTEEVMDFDEHLNQVHEILGGLIAHSRALRDTLEDFADIYALIDEDYDEVEEDETEEVPDDAEANA
jgi:N-dimethylarginine dimethylaminohydrolase